MNTTTADRSSHILAAAMWLALSSATVVPGALAQMAPPPGYIYSRHVMASLTQSCLAPAPGGSFVGIGQGFTANAQAVVLAKESGELRLVAFGFNSIADCAYDRTRDVLYVSDNAGEDELPGATTGDTVFAIPSASTATGLPAASLALLPAGALPAAASLAVDGNGDLLVGDAAGGTAGTVSRIDVDLGPPAMAMPFAGGFAFTGGLAVDAASGDVWVAETLSSPPFQSQIRRFDASGTSLGVFAVFYGLDWVATVPPTVKLTTEAFGRENTGVIYGWIGASHQLGASMAAFGAGAIRTELGDYRAAFLIAGLLCLIAGASFLTVGRVLRSHAIAAKTATAEA